MTPTPVGCYNPPVIFLVAVALALVSLAHDSAGLGWLALFVGVFS